MASTKTMAISKLEHLFAILLQDEKRYECILHAQNPQVFCFLGQT